MMFPMMTPSDAPCHIGAPMPNNAMPIPSIMPPELLHGFPSPTLCPAPPYQLQQSSTSSNATNGNQTTQSFRDSPSPSVTPSSIAKPSSSLSYCSAQVASPAPIANPVAPLVTAAPKSLLLLQ